jgi:hypothetical protein
MLRMPNLVCAVTQGLELVDTPLRLQVRVVPTSNI